MAQSHGSDSSWASPQRTSPLFNLLKGSDDLASHHTLTLKAHEALYKVARAISSRHVHRVDRALLLQSAILGKSPNFHTVLFQWDPTATDQLLTIKWLFLSHQLRKTVTISEERIAQLSRANTTSVPLQCVTQHALFCH